MTRGPRALYLDLLIDCLSNLIHGPAPVDPWNDGLFRRDAPPGRDAASPAHTMVGILRLRSLRDLAQQIVDEAIPGDLIETGVWRVGCCILMRGVLAANADTERRVFVADSFAGVPPPRPDLFPADAGDTLHTMRELAIPADQVRANFDRYGLLDGQVVFVEAGSATRCPASPASDSRCSGWTATCTSRPRSRWRICIRACRPVASSSSTTTARSRNAGRR